MPLGPQFNNTYWNEEPLGLVSSRVTPAEQHGSEGGKVTQHLGVEADQPLQGMLLNPHWGTGTSKDPSLAPGEYRAAALHALGHDRPFRTQEKISAPARADRYGKFRIPLGRDLTADEQSLYDEQKYVDIEGHRYQPGQVTKYTDHDPDPAAHYQYEMSKSINGSFRVTRDQAEKDLNDLVGTLEDSNTPIHELQNTPAHGATMFGNTSRTLRNVGGYDSFNGDIMVRYRRGEYPTNWPEGYGFEVLIHELGHKRDPNVGEAYKNPDPAAEGIADARATRHGRYAERLHSEMMQNLAHDVQNHGYTHKYWKSPADQALYAASRAVVTAHGDAGAAVLPSRGGIFLDVTGKYIDHSDASEHRTARSLMLGHLMENHPIVRHTIGQMHEDVAAAASKAHANYLSLTTPPPQGKQGEMFTGGTDGKPLTVSPKAKPPAKYRMK